jgi:MerR family redox-sensitive transcriptional activator SoxR
MVSDMTTEGWKALTVGEVAERSGVATSALRFYEEQGLIRSRRTEAGHRRYPRAVLRRIAFIVFAQKVGLTLEQVSAELAKLPDDAVPTQADWAKLSSTWRARIDERIAELQRLRDTLSSCIGCGCLSLTECRVVNPADRAAALGPGPQRWQRVSAQRVSAQRVSASNSLATVHTRKRR